MKNIGIYIIATLAIVAWLLVKAPTPEFFLLGADGGHQLAGAMQILSMGEHPYVDFFETYGPLTFYSSALAQYLTGVRPVGEIILIIGGFTAGYLFLFALVRQILKDSASSFLLLFLALILLPQFYKYYCVLVPLFSLFCASLYIRKPLKRWTFTMLALSVAIAALYRHDFGVFSFLMVISLFCMESSFSWPHIFVKIIKFCAAVLFFMAPWLLFLFWQGALVRYLSMMFYASRSMSKGLSLPHPLLHWTNPYLSISFLLFFSIPLLGFFIYLRHRGELPNNEKKMLLATTVLSAVSLLQSSHRADYYHLLEGIPASFVCLAFVVKWGRGWRLQKKFIFSAACCLLILVPVALAAPSSMLPAKQRLDVSRKVTYYFLDRQKFIDKLAADVPDFWPAKVVQIVRDNTQPDTRVAFFPFHMKFNYFTNRPFAAGIMLLAPGYFDSQSYQQQTIAKLRQQRVPYVLWNEHFSYDGLPERNPVVVFGALHQAVVQDYTQKGMLYGFTVYALE